MLGACSSTPIDSNEQGATESDVGSVNLPLTTSVGGVDYRLNKATFTIVGPTLAKPLVVVPPADEPVHNVVLPSVPTRLSCRPGWVLERRGLTRRLFAAVAARARHAESARVRRHRKSPADAFFGFVTTSGDVSLGKGSVNIRIGVQDCSSYDAITAALRRADAELPRHGRSARLQGEPRRLS